MVEKVKKEYESKQEKLEQLVGQLTVEVNWFKKNLVTNTSREERQTMLELNDPEITLRLRIPFVFV
jgi:putative transposase